MLPLGYIAQSAGQRLVVFCPFEVAAARWRLAFSFFTQDRERSIFHSYLCFRLLEALFEGSRSPQRRWTCRRQSQHSRIEDCHLPPTEDTISKTLSAMKLFKAAAQADHSRMCVTFKQALKGSGSGYLADDPRDCDVHRLPGIGNETKRACRRQQAFSPWAGWNSAFQAR